MEGIKKLVDERMSELSRGIVATPESREALDSFAKFNNGSNDFLLVQMAVQFGYKMAMEDVQEKMEE